MADGPQDKRRPMSHFPDGAPCCLTSQRFDVDEIISNFTLPLARGYGQIDGAISMDSPSFQPRPSSLPPSLPSSLALALSLSHSCFFPSFHSSHFHSTNPMYLGLAVSCPMCSLINPGPEEWILHLT